MVTHRKRRSEKSHHRISDIFIECPTLFDEDIRHIREIGCHEEKEIIRCELLRDRRETCDIREHDRHRSSLTSELYLLTLLRYFGDDTRIYIVSEVFLHLALLAIHNEESVYECHRK